jgi:hypothetical protein
MNLEHLKGEELFSYLRNNKKELLQIKVSSLKLCDAVIGNTTIINREPKTEVTKEDTGDTPSEPGTLHVKMVANVANVVDSYMDMLLPGAYTESINKRGTSIPHLLDHNQSAIGHIGDVTKVYTQDMSITELGYSAPGMTEALLMESTVRKDYNPETYKFYSNGKINQHSIGLSYGSLELAINSSHEADKVEKATWDKYYPQVINKDIVDKKGYFYVVPKVDVRENSAVLFGANPLTPTLSIKSNSSAQEILPLENEEETVITQPIGNTMNLEEALGEIISLKTDLANAKAEVGIAKASARLEEKTRTLGILKAQTTFGSEDALKEAAHEFIEKDYDLKAATSMLESLKGHIQKASHVDTTETTLSATQIPQASKEASFEEELLGGIKSLAEQPQLFKGVR